MHKKVLSCLVYFLLLTISFLLTGFPEAEQLAEDSSFSASLIPSEEIASASFPLPGQQEQDRTEETTLCLLQQRGLHALIPSPSVCCRQFDHLRKLSFAELPVYPYHLVYRQLSSLFIPSLFPAFIAVPGLPVLLRTLRL